MPAEACGMRLGMLLVAIFLSLAPLSPVASYVLEYRASLQASGWARLWVPLPLENAVQSVQDLQVKASVPHRIGRDGNGNRLLYLEGNGPLEARVSLRVSRQAQDSPLAEPAERERWLQPERLVPRGEPFHSLALSVVPQDSDAQVAARRIYDHVVGTMAYDKAEPGWGQGDATRACSVRKGNCSDFNSLLIALCREAGLPARLVMGYSIPEGEQGELNGYHCWSEVFLDGWVPMDPSESRKHPERRDYYFGHLDPYRVAITLGRDLRLSPPQDGPPLNYLVYPYAEVDGVPVPVEHSARYTRGRP